MQDQRPIKKSKKLPPTSFLSLPLELRQIILRMVFAEDLVLSKTYGDCFRAHRQYHNITYSYKRECRLGATVHNLPHRKSLLRP